VEEISLWVEILTLVEECTYLLPEWTRYGARVDAMRDKLPGASDLLHVLNSTGLLSRVHIIEISHMPNRQHVQHQFSMHSACAIRHHWDSLVSSHDSTWTLHILDNPKRPEILFFGQLLDIPPQTFLSHIWREFQPRPSDSGLAILERPFANLGRLGSPKEPRFLSNPDLNTVLDHFYIEDPAETRSSAITFPGHAFLRHWPGGIEQDMDTYERQLGGRRVSSTLHWEEVPKAFANVASFKSTSGLVLRSPHRGRQLYRTLTQEAIKSLF
jgi:hypothetical protein